MQSVLDWLSGKKTYILLFIGLVFNIGVTAKWWAQDSSIWQSIDVLLTALLGGTFRAAIAKSGPNGHPPPPPPPLPAAKSVYKEREYN